MGSGGPGALVGLRGWEVGLGGVVGGAAEFELDAL